MGGPVPPADAPTPASPEGADNTNKIAVGAIVAVAVVVVAIIFAKGGSEPDEACKLSGVAVGLVAIAVHQGETAQAVIGSTALSPICKQVVETAVDEPEAPVEAEIVLPHLDQTTEYVGSGQELSEQVAQAPESAPTSTRVDPEFTRRVECVLAYGSNNSSYNACMIGGGFSP